MRVTSVRPDIPAPSSVSSIAFATSRLASSGANAATLLPAPLSQAACAPAPFADANTS